MKLVHPELEGQIIFDDQNPCQWVIESPKDYSAYVKELFSQIEGNEGRFVLSEGEKEKDICKCMEIIFNPFSISINDRKILNKLYSELSELSSDEEMYMETQEMKNNLQAYFLKLEHVSPYILETDIEIDIMAILKAIGVRFSDYSDDFILNLNQYIKLMAELMRKKVVVLINIGSYVTYEQLEQVIKNAAYNEIALLMIENVQKKLPEKVYQYIIDKDSCEIF